VKLDLGSSIGQKLRLLIFFKSHIRAGHVACLWEIRSWPLTSI